MVRKVISLFLIGSLLLSTYGCLPSTSVKAFPSDPDLAEGKITAVVLANCDTVAFDEHGGVYVVQGDIVGRSAGDKALSVSLREVTEWSFSRLDSARGQRVEMTRQIPSHTVFLDTTVRISMITSSDEVTHKFANEGGRIVRGSAGIAGIQQGDSLTRMVPIDSVLYLRVERADAVVTTLMTLSTVGVLAGFAVVGFIAAAALSQISR